MRPELLKRISKYEEQLLKLKHEQQPLKNIDKSKISHYIVDHWQLLTISEERAFLNDFVEKIVIVKTKMSKKVRFEVLEIKFYEE